MNTQQSNQKEKDQVKVVLLGDTEVGKTSIIHRFIHNDFQSKFQTTQGVHFEQKTVVLDDGQQLDFKIWDTAGQERFRSINQLYYRDARAAIIVYDITDKSSFETLKFWYRFMYISNIYKFSITNTMQAFRNLKTWEKKFIAIVGNKQDLVEQEQVNYNEVKNYARQHGAIMKLTSALQGNGVLDLFKDIGYAVQKQKNENRLKATKSKSENNLQLDQSKVKNNGEQKEKSSCC